MDFRITVDGNNRTSLIKYPSLKIKETQDAKAGTCDFRYEKYGSRTWIPTMEDEIFVYDDDRASLKMFAGRIIAVKPKLTKSETIEYTIKCKDWNVDLDKGDFIAQTYTLQTVQQIIDDIIPGGFTTTNVDGGYIVDQIKFNYKHVSEAIQMLADLVGFKWYVDYDKDIHFFAKYKKSAPFDVVDNSPNVIGGSVVVDLNNSQLRNKVYVFGGEYVGNSRTENYDGDGSQKTFPLGNKFSEKPTVTVNGVPQNVGTDPLEVFADGPPYDCLWNFQEKFLIFSSAPTAGHTVATTGTPLVPLATQQESPSSIGSFGVRSYKIKNKSFVELGTARKRSSAELEAYENGVREGVFLSYIDGLRPGQTQLINLTALSVNEHFMIDKLTTTIHTRTKASYSVNLVSQKTLGIVDFLQKLLKANDDFLEANGDEVIVISKAVNEDIQITEEINVVAERAVHENIEITELIRQDPWGLNVITWVWGPYFPVNDADSKRPMRWDRFYWA